MYRRMFASAALSLALAAGSASLASAQGMQNMQGGQQKAPAAQGTQSHEGHQGMSSGGKGMQRGARRAHPTDNMANQLNGCQMMNNAGDRQSCMNQMMRR